MRQNGIAVARPRKHAATMGTNHQVNIALRPLDHYIVAKNPIQKRSGDRTYIWALERRLYLAVLLHLHSRRVVCWAALNLMKRDA